MRGQPGADGDRRSRGRLPLGMLAIVVLIVGIVIGTGLWGGPATRGRTPAPALAGPEAWHLAWRAENAFASSTSSTQTCRFAALLTAYGDQVRAEFTNPIVESKGYVISSSSIALSAGSGLTVSPDSSTPLTFGGKASVMVGAGAIVLSDPVPMVVTLGTTVDVTMTVPAGDAPAAQTAEEPAACTTGTVAGEATAPASAFETAVSTRWLQSIQVSGPPQRSIVAFGDSITAGPATPAHVRWSDVLTHYHVAVANAGVSGGELTRPGLFGSLPGITRVPAVLAEPNITDLVVLIGTNDISAGIDSTDVLDALSDVISQAEHRGVQVWVATILPRSETAAMNDVRHQVNDTLRSSWLTSRGAKVIDTDLALRDPANPDTLRQAWDCGDHIHPNPAGEQQLGMTVAAALGLT